jgi:hypothetical protein
MGARAQWEVPAGSAFKPHTAVIAELNHTEYVLVLRCDPASPKAILSLIRNFGGSSTHDHIQ